MYTTSSREVEMERAEAVAQILDANAWPEPQDLTAKLERFPYPLEALPETVQRAVAEVQSFTKAPMALVASSALSTLSLAIQAHYDVKRAEKLSGPCSLFTLVIADSGERKSTVDTLFTAAIRDYEGNQVEVARPEIARYRADMDTWEAKRAGIKDKIRALAKDAKPTGDMERALRDLDKPVKPKVPRLLHGDVTPESLAFSLAKDWPSGGVVSAEAGLVFGSHGMGKDSVMRNLALLNILWDGGNLNIGRRTSESFTVAGARLTVGLQVQEATLRDFLERSGALARGTGFLARFLIAWPESTIGFRPFTEAPADWPALAAFNRRLTAILDLPAPIDDNGGLAPSMLALTPDAKAAWVAFHDEIESSLANGGELYDVRDVASKIADNAVRLATLFWIFEGGTGAVGLEAFTGAAQIVAWHLNESRRFFGELALPTELADAARLDTWLLDHCRREKVQRIATKTVQQFGPSGLRDKSAIESALEELADLGRARPVKEGKRKVIEVNPALLKGRA